MYLLLLFIYIYTNIINYTVIFTLLISQYYTKLYAAAAAMFSVIETTTERIMFLKVVYYDERFGVFIVLKKNFFNWLLYYKITKRPIIIQSWHAWCISCL